MKKGMEGHPNGYFVNITVIDELSED